MIERDTAMAQCVLSIRCELSERDALVGQEEQRVVPKPACSSCYLCDPPLYAANDGVRGGACRHPGPFQFTPVGVLGCSRSLLGNQKHERAYKSSASILRRNLAHPFEQQRIIIGVGDILTSESRAVYTRRASQMVYRQP